MPHHIGYLYKTPYDSIRHKIMQTEDGTTYYMYYETRHMLNNLIDIKSIREGNLIHVTGNSL